MTIDLRSDTVTRPTPAMRAAMAAAEVGDDVYGEDPTVNRLEARAAEIFGREAGLFVPTGTMGNQVAVRMHAEQGQEVICEARSHILDWEMAMSAAFSGCQARTVAGERGILTHNLHDRRDHGVGRPRRVGIGHLNLALVLGLQQIGPAARLGQLLLGQQFLVEPEAQRPGIDAKRALLGGRPLTLSP